MSIQSEYAARFITSRPKAEIVETCRSLMDWLHSLNTHNRKLKPSVVKTYREEMERGAWMLTSQGIGISEDGVLVDGQHRIEGNIEAGYPRVPMLIVSGLDMSAQLKVDNHAKRSTSDILALCMNISSDKSMSSALRLIVALRSEVVSFSEKVPIEEIIDAYREFEPIIKEFGNFGSKRVSAPMASAILIAAQNGLPVDVCKRFLDGVATGENLSRTSPIMRFREKWLNAKIHGGFTGSKGQEALFCLTARALVASANGECLDKLYKPDLADAVNMLKRGRA